MNELRDFLNWFDGFVDNIEKTPNKKQWDKIKERVKALESVKVVANGVDGSAHVASPAAAAVSKAPVSPPAPVKRDPLAGYDFFIDEEGFVRRTKGRERVSVQDVGSALVADIRPGESDLGAVFWGDGSDGVRHFDGTIVSVNAAGVQ